MNDKLVMATVAFLLMTTAFNLGALSERISPEPVDLDPWYEKEMEICRTSLSKN